jgi:hypothetical protein
MCIFTYHIKQKGVTMSIFGPEDTKVYTVDLFTGKIDSYMTSKDEAEVDACNGDCFLTEKKAIAKSKEIQKKLKGN